MKQMDANAREIHTIEFLAGLDAQLTSGQEHLRERLQSIPGGVAELSAGRDHAWGTRICGC